MHNTRVLTTSDLLGWPEDWLTRYFNACTDPCDMLIGPCACGAWHSKDDWDDVLGFYHAEILIIPKNQDNQHNQELACTLSYF